MSPKQRVLAALRLEEPDRVPFFEFSIDEDIGARILNKSACIPYPRRHYEILEGISYGPMIGGTNYKPDELAQKLHLDGFGYRFSPLLFTEKRHSSKDDREFLGKGMVRTRRDLKKIKLPDPDDDEIYEPARNFVENYGKNYATFCYFNVGIDNVIHSLGFEKFAIALYEDRALVVELLDLFTSWIEKAAVHLCDLGFDVIWVGGDIAYKKGPLVSPTLFRSLFLPRMKKIAEKISLPWIYHSDGNIVPIIEDLLSLGMNGLNPIDPKGMDIFWMKKHYGKRICLVGNIDVDLLARASPNLVKQITMKTIEGVGMGGAYILASGNSITSYCRVENVLAMCEVLQKYGKYPL